MSMAFFPRHRGAGAPEAPAPGGGYEISGTRRIKDDAPAGRSFISAYLLGGEGKPWSSISSRLTTHPLKYINFASLSDWRFV